MGTTSEKLTYLNGTKQELKQAINNIGGEVTDETTFREYVNQLQNVYDNLPKTEYQEGTGITIENGLKGKLDFEDDKVGYGQTSQDSTQGYQMYCLPPSKTSNGITYTNNGDGTCDIVGTATANFDVALATRIPIAESPLVLGESYNISVLEALPDVTFQVVEYASNDTWIATTGLIRNSQSQNITIPNNSNVAFIDYNIRVYSGATVDAKGIKLMMNTGTSRKDFEQYTGGQASPNPSYPQEIKCVAGKNLFNKNTITHQILNANGTATDTQDGYFSSDFIEIDSSKQYTKTATGSIRVKLYDSSKNAISTSSFSDIADFSNAQTFSIPYSNARYVRFTMNGDYINSIMFEEGSTSTSYLPYNTIEEVVSGKNLWGLGTRVNGYCAIFNGGVWTGTDDTISSFYFETSKLPDQVTFKIDNGNRANVSYYNTLPMGTTNVANSYETTSYTTLPRTINVNKQYKYVFIQVCYGVNKDQLTNGQMESGDTLGTYEPYITPTSYQLSLGDRKVFEGDYFWIDKTTGKKYHHHKMAEYVFTGNENLSTGYSNTSRTGFYYNFSDILPISSGTETPNIKADKFRAVTMDDTWGYGMMSMLTYSGSTDRVYFFIEANKTLIDIQTILAGMHFCYPLDTETDEEITGTLAEQLEAWWNGQTLNGTTIITSNGNLPMIIKVRGLKGE